MKRVILTLLLLVCAGSISAQKSQREIKEPRVRFGIVYRYSLSLAEQHKVKVVNHNQSRWITPDELRGGEFLLEGTVKINRNWNTGLGVGFGGYDGYIKTFKTYVKGERLYGQRASRWFNYADLGATLYPGKGTGLTAELGGGYRLAMTRRTRLDLTVGFEYLNLVVDAYSFDTGVDYKNGGRINRFGLTFGLAMHF